MATQSQFTPMEQFGSPRFLGSPLVPLPCSRDQGRASRAMPSQHRGFAPAIETTKATAIYRFSRLNHTASVLAVYASSFGFPYTGKTRFRRVANPYRVGFEPTGLLRRISKRLHSPFIPTPQASPGATLCSMPFFH